MVHAFKKKNHGNCFFWDHHAWYMHLKKPWQLFFWDHQGRTFELSWLS